LINKKDVKKNQQKVISLSDDLSTRLRLDLIFYLIPLLSIIMQIFLLYQCFLYVFPPLILAKKMFLFGNDGIVPSIAW